MSISTDTAAPVPAGVRPQAGGARSSRSPASIITEAVNTAIEARAQAGNVPVRGDSVYCGGKIINALVKARALLLSTGQSEPTRVGMPTRAARPMLLPFGLARGDIGAYVSTHLCR